MMADLINQWLVSVNTAIDLRFNITEEINTHGDELITLNLENKNKLAFIQIYKSGYLHIQIASKENLTTSLPIDMKFSSSIDLISTLDKHFLKEWLA